MKSILKQTLVKVWLIVTIIVLILMVSVTVVTTQMPFIYGTINSVLGGHRRVLQSGNPEDYMIFQADYASKNEALTAANALNEQIVEEGIILLKNEDNVLPLKSSSKLTVFGKNSTNLVLGGSGSSAGTGASSNFVDLYGSLSKVGFTYNPIAKSFFESSASGNGRPSTPGMGSILTGYPISETPKTAYENNSSLQNSYQDYNDAAIVVITRIGGEGYDLPRTMFWDNSSYTNWNGTDLIPGARSKEDHYLQLDQNETDLLKEAAANFENVIVLINSSTPLELGFLDDPTHYAYHENIKAALWIGNPGESGVSAVGKVLNGSINPSGKTVDTYSRNFKNDPSWQNFGNNMVLNGNRYTTNGTNRNAYYVEYEEGIYVGYRYYETRGFIEGEGWYENQVVYPFGYGLSYTTFTQEIVETNIAENLELSSADNLIIKVKVTNTGTVSGKEVVQLYYNAPYIEGEIEKAHVVLGDFGKTKLLEPTESQTLTLTIPVRRMASYDYNDANNNGFKGYELDGGNYSILLMKNAHEVIDELKYSVAPDGIKFTNDAVTNTEIANLFDDVSDHITTYLSRENFEGTWPTMPTESDRAVDEAFISLLNYSLNDQPTDPWYSSVAPHQSAIQLSSKETTVKLYDLVGKSYEDPLWDDLLDQLTISQMKNLISKGNFKTINLDNISKPMTIDADGPMGFAIFMGDPSVYGTAYYASETVLGATWNSNLAFEMGKMVGNEGLIGNERGDGRPYSGWYAPAMNIHRSQFGGRNFEYYSEDGYLSGILAQAVVSGAKTKGVYTYVKHFALNDQETNRDTTGLITWANEQAMRELYFVPFEIVVKQGETTAFMSAFNRIGTTWAGGSYPLLTELLREEWGFRGMVITDFNLTHYMNVDQMIRAGGDLNLSPSKSLSADNSPTSQKAIRQATKNILYTTANSNIMNGIGEGVSYRYALPTWQIWLNVTNVAVVIALGTWGFFTIKKATNKITNIKEGSQENENEI